MWFVKPLVGWFQGIDGHCKVSSQEEGEGMRKTRGFW
jgi:hypothetical protein